MEKQFKPIVVIAGPTGSGKTAMAINLAKQLDGEIVNADSRSIYKELDIGTGTPTEEEMAGIPHHLFSIISPTQYFSVAEFKELANEIISDIHSRGKIPFVVGGTGLYIDSVVYDYKTPDTKADWSLRKKLDKQPLDSLLEELFEIDPDSFMSIDLGNKRKVIRALEIYKDTGRPKIAQESKTKLPKNILYLGIETNKAELYEKLNKRVDKWETNGFTEEANKLFEKYPKSAPALNGIGYKQYGRFLDGEITLDEALENFKKGDRNLAKKQLTWFRRNPDITWIKNRQETEQKINNFLTN